MINKNMLMKANKLMLMGILTAGMATFAHALVVVDSDGDGVADNLDAFPNDAAASVDYDRDGRADAWNTGATAAQIAASPLVLDPKPGNAAMQTAEIGIYAMDNGQIVDSYSGTTRTPNANGTNTAGTQVANRFGDPYSAIEFLSANTASGSLTIPKNLDLTVAVWAKSPNINWNQSGILASARVPSGFILNSQRGANTMTGVVMDDFSNLNAIAPVAAPAGNDITVWHHYALTYDSATFTGRVFIDGVQVATNKMYSVMNPFSPRTAGGTVAVYIGSDVGSFGTRYGDVALDDFRVYKKALTAAEIDALAGDFTPPTLTILGNASENVVQNSTFTDAGATAADAKDGDITARITKGGTFVDTSTVGTFTITYDVLDLDGNAAAQLTRNITVTAAPSNGGGSTGGNAVDPYAGGTSGSYPCIAPSSGMLPTLFSLLAGIGLIRRKQK